MKAITLKYVRNKHLHLFVFLIAILLCLPFIEDFMVRDLPTVSLVFLGGLTLTLWALNLRPRTFVICAGMAVLIYIFELLFRMLPQGADRFDIGFVTWLLYAAFLAACIIIMFRKIFMARHGVSLDTIIGGINIYLLLAFLWTITYRLINIIDPYSFNIHGRLGMTQLIFYSYSTISTLGIGNIVPVNKFAMMISSLEAITGQLYIAIFVAMLVSLHIMGKKNDE